MPEEKYDPVNHPAHYTQYKHEVIELTGQLDFCLGNAVKYILRAPFKGSEEQDLQKARWYLCYWRVRNFLNDKVFEPSLIDLAETYDVAILNALFNGRNIFDGVQSAMAVINKQLDQLARDRVNAENEELKRRVADLERQLADARKEVR